jgi:predicted amidohydrolase YtcJ
VVLEQNLFDVAPDKIADVKVVATVMGGEFTYRDGL